jgi:sortase A
MVLNGHHNVYGQVFVRLVDVAVGDEVQLEADGRLYDFVVTQTDILPEMGQPIEVRMANAERILPTADERVTLVTCWPYSGNSHRLVVVARPASVQFLGTQLQ